MRRDGRTPNSFKQSNRNPLIYRDIGADGLKTGHTEAAGYGLTASAERDGRRIVMVLNGMESVRQRSQESLRVMEWAFRTFKPYALFKKDDVITTADIWLGATSTVPLVIPEALKLTLSRDARTKMKVVVRMQNPVAAPVQRTCTSSGSWGGSAQPSNTSCGGRPDATEFNESTGMFLRARRFWGHIVKWWGKLRFRGKQMWINTTMQLPLFIEPASVPTLRRGT